MNPNNEIAPRTFVVEMSVKIEHLSNVIISRLLGVNPDETRSFGTSSFALSFNAKANLLLDLNYLNKEQGQVSNIHGNQKQICSCLFS